MGSPIPKADLLAHLRDLDDQIDGPVTGTYMDEQGNYARSTYRNHFGSWAAAKEAAGLETHYRTSQKQLLDHLQEVADRLGHEPSWDEMHDIGDHNPEVYVRRFGSWKDAKVEADVVDSTSSKTVIPAADQTPNLSRDAMSFVTMTWRDIHPLLEVNEDAPFVRNDLPDSVTDWWGKLCDLDDIIEKQGRLGKSGDVHTWALTDAAEAKLREIVTNFEAAAETDSTPLPCECYPLAMVNHGDEIECRNCGQFHDRAKCGTDSDDAGGSGRAPQARADGGRNVSTHNHDCESDPNHDETDTNTNEHNSTE